MKIRNAFRRGFSLMIHHRMIIGIIYLVNLCIALLFAVPTFILFHEKVGALLLRDDLLSGLPYSWWSSFHFNAEGLEKTIRPSLAGFGPLLDNLELLLTGQIQSYGWFVICIGLAYLFIAAFFNGGAIALYADERRSFSTGRFLSFAGTYFHHMAALAVTTLVLFALVFKVIQPAIFSLVDQVVGDSLSQSFAWSINLIGYALILVLIFLLTLILDYAKVILISEKKNSSWICIGLAAAFIFRNAHKTIGLNLLLVLLAAALVLVAGLLSMINSSQLLLLILGFIFQQLFIAAKIATRLTFYAAETALYQEYAAARETVKKRKR
ncbi:hypothetical protein JXA02_03460 [candidate division KSB1 bacterium]|nr:hypothetical protein [candidate division KSB1 bacterium]RQW09452.1 MAG: hypothetical protein EH222_03895 [candidate division KSB1 bacterium]